jgi:hypothetical protein
VKKFWKFVDEKLLFLISVVASACNGTLFPLYALLLSEMMNIMQEFEVIEYYKQ